jgi:hypothetical protein
MRNTLRDFEVSADKYISREFSIDIRQFQTHIQQAPTSLLSVLCGELLLVRVLPILIEVDEEPRLWPDHWEYRNHFKILRHILRSFDCMGSALRKCSLWWLVGIR